MAFGCNGVGLVSSALRWLQLAHLDSLSGAGRLLCWKFQCRFCSETNFHGELSLFPWHTGFGVIIFKTHLSTRRVNELNLSHLMISGGLTGWKCPHFATSPKTCNFKSISLLLLRNLWFQWKPSNKSDLRPKTTNNQFHFEKLIKWHLPRSSPCFPWLLASERKATCSMTNFQTTSRLCAEVDDITWDWLRGQPTGSYAI